jgi:hypothetical protein
VENANFAYLAHASGYYSWILKCALVFSARVHFFTLRHRQRKTPAEIVAADGVGNADEFGVPF